MKTKDFLKKHDACSSGAKWALSISKEMSDVWDAMIKDGKHKWLLWTATRPGVFSDSILRKLACRFVRETPLSDGRTVWDLLTDECSKRVVEVAERYADGKATAQELAAADAAAYTAAAARDAADAAAYTAACAAAHAAAYDAVYTAACADADAAAYTAAAARDAAYTAAYAADADAYDAAADDAKAAQVQMIAEMGNPFKKERATK